MDVMAKGVAIIAVNPNGIAANYGFQPGDIVRSINGVNINRVGELVRALNNTNQWDMVIERGGRKLTLSVQG
jgi:serine protease Do